ncbi:MAG TPA: TRAP transporter small permease [Burkholderiales bacterium]|nr:TRAP transporter small permease [Burkholderiales bacterium]
MSLERLSRAYGRFLTGLALAGCAVLFAMMMLICADVLLRNVRLVPGVYGISWSSEVTEYCLYLITLLTAPWLLRQGQHIRVDIVLRVVPPRLAWYCEWACDAIALASCLVIAAAAWQAAAASLAIGAMVVKTLAVPEWWLLAPMQVTFVLLAIEVVFRMERLHAGPRGPRGDAVSTG